MAHRSVTFIVSMSLLIATGAAADDRPQFRGPARDGKSAKTGLLKQWPADGPKLLWTFEQLGAGYTSVAANEQMLYTTGVEDETGYLYALDRDGNLLWKEGYGKGWTGDLPGPRSTPTVDDDRVYVMSGHGRVVCYNARTGAQNWAVDTAATFGARNLPFGTSESLLIDGDRLICTPGGGRQVSSPSTRSRAKRFGSAASRRKSRLTVHRFSSNTAGGG